MDTPEMQDEIAQSKEAADTMLRFALGETVAPADLQRALDTVSQYRRFDIFGREAFRFLVARNLAALRARRDALVASIPPIALH